jgi:hypothetical protein
MTKLEDLTQGRDHEKNTQEENHGYVVFVLNIHGSREIGWYGGGGVFLFQ